MKARAHVFVRGVVQGVFFRATTRDTAIQAGVSGFVRNTGDGGVEAVFEGDREKVERMVQYCHNGPPGSRVEHVDVSWEEFKGEFGGFFVRY
jgi:acylphosphatase